MKFYENWNFGNFLLKILKSYENFDKISKFS